MDPSIPLTGVLNRYTPDYSTLFTSHSLPHGQNPTTPNAEDWLPPFIRILNTLLQQTQHEKEGSTFLTNITVLHEFAFSPRSPILGTGHHFVVHAIPFDKQDLGFTAIDKRDINPQVYCLKVPNFTSGGAADSAATKEAFRNEYYDTVLQELRVLLHPSIRLCENIISLFGLDFQEDYDEYAVAWPVLLTEYAEYGTLDTLQQDIAVNLELARILLLDTARGIQALHDCNIIHGDVKSENILICRHPQRKYIARLSDFGLSILNPDPESENHKLPGCTFLWAAPEVKSSLSVEGLKKTDVYSFGLTAWRVFVNHTNPFELIPAGSIAGAPSSLDQLMVQAKSQEFFAAIVLQTMKSSASHIYCRQVIEATIRNDPLRRDLNKTITALNLGHGVVERMRGGVECGETYWSAELPSLVLEQAIVFRYHEVYGISNPSLDVKWLEATASSGSYYAHKMLRMRYPQEYRRLIQSPLSIEPHLSSEFDGDGSLLSYCRQGNYEGCKTILRAGASAFPLEEGKLTLLHWLVMFQDGTQINDLLHLFLENGAVIDAWAGHEDNLTLGLVIGTALHWAIWFRNIPMLRALTRVDNDPNPTHVNRAIFIAAGMHFYDILEILASWISRIADFKSSFKSSKCDWTSALMAASENSTWRSPRLLRHGTTKSQMAFSNAMEIILRNHAPSEETVRKLFRIAMLRNNAKLLDYLFTNLHLGQRGLSFNDPSFDPGVISLGMGFTEIFEICIKYGILGPKKEHGAQKWMALQICCCTRQRNEYFMRRLLEIGCLPDGAARDGDAMWTPFSIAVAQGLYELAIILLEHGANKDYLLGWLGGSTITMNLLQHWPDIPISRLKFLLEDIPRLGFGHVAFWGWPCAGGNLLYSLAMNHWSSYTAGYRLGESARFILSKLADKSCLDRIDKIGATALRMACSCGNLEICRALIEAGQDVNLSLGSLLWGMLKTG